MEHYEYPWYFEQLGVMDAWTISHGSGVVVDLIDSCVDFNISLLKDKNYQQKFSSCDGQNKEDALIIHGTAMASLIAADSGSLPKIENMADQLFIAGIAPEVEIKNTIGAMNVNNLFEALKEAQEEKLKTIYNIDVLKSSNLRARPDIILINLSGGQISSDTYIRTEWNEQISKVCDENTNVLIMTAVGNSGAYLTKHTIMTDGLLPSILKPSACNKASTDPIIRVGATNHYNTTEKPLLYRTQLGTGSSWGKDYVDILAPGQSIPVIIPGGFSRIVGGTSEATAIVTATAALLVSCQPYANSQAIREAILDNAFKYQHLKEVVHEGNVLDVKKTVKQFCVHHKGSDGVRKDNTKDEL